MNNIELPNSLLRFRAVFPENKKKFHKLYAVRISFANPYYLVEETNSVIKEWIYHHKAAFNEIWLQPEMCPSSRRVHYHGLVDVKDQFRMNKFLRMFKPVGSFHLETIKSTIGQYLEYCMKEVGETEAMERTYKDFLIKTGRYKGSERSLVSAA